MPLCPPPLAAVLHAFVIFLEIIPLIYVDFTYSTKYLTMHKIKGGDMLLAILSRLVKYNKNENT
jgi:hypothetical protein